VEVEADLVAPGLEVNEDCASLSVAARVKEDSTCTTSFSPWRSTTSANPQRHWMSC